MKTIAELITFFEGIPEEKWVTNYLEQGDKRCALGHLHAHLGKGSGDWNVSNAVLTPLGIQTDDLAFANNGLEDSIYYLSPFTEAELKEMGDTPKKRVVSFLKSREKVAV